jgi:hypothetical protein
MQITETDNQETETTSPPIKKASREWLWHIGALLFFVVLTVQMTGAIWNNAGRTIEGWGDALLQVWTLDWTAHALATDPFNLFNANAFYPYHNSLAFSETLFGQAIFVTPLIWLTNNPVLAYNLLLLASFVLSGWGMYLLVSHLTGSKEAGLVAGVIFAYFPHRYGQLSHLHLLATQWMPFTLLFLSRYFRDKKWTDLALFGLFFTLQFWSSTYLGLFLAVVVGLYLLFRIGVRGQRSGVRKKERPKFSASSVYSAVSFQIGICLLLVGLAILPFYLPYLQVQNELGFERSPAEVDSFSAQWFYYLDVPKENKLNQWVYQPITGDWQWWDSSRGGERGLYLGFFALILGIMGMVLAWRQRKTQPQSIFYAGLAILAVSFTFGTTWRTSFGDLPLPYALLYNFVPGFAGLRVPVRFIYVVALAVAVLAGITVAGLISRLRLKKWRTAVLVVPLIGLMCLEYVSDVGLIDSNILSSAPPPAIAYTAQNPGVVLNVPLSGSDNSNLFYQYWSRASWQPVMNGFSGFMPPAYDQLKRAWAIEFPSPRLLDLLQGLEVRWLIIDSEDGTVKPTWEKTQKEIAKFPQLTLRQKFGAVYVYEVTANAWAKDLRKYIQPQDLVYFVDYRRGDPQIIELITYYLQREKVIKRENTFGQMNMGFKPLGALPQGSPANALILEKGEDPTLYGFTAQTKVFENSLLAVYTKSSDLLARYDFSRKDEVGAIAGKIKRVEVRDKKLEFSGGTMGAPPRGEGNVVKLAFAVTQPQPLELRSGTDKLSLKLEPGVSTIELNSGQSGAIEWSGENVSLVWAELWQGTSSNPPILKPLNNVALIEAQTRQDGTNAVATLRVVPKGGTDYTATLDVYNYPWGSHPQGHYGYWSVALPGEGGKELEYSLNLPRKEMTTKINGGTVPNYPPDPKDLDIAKYGNLGDFRATFTLYAGDKLAGSIRLFDFTIRADGDKNKIENRKLSDFRGYNTTLSFLVLPL